MLSPNVGTARAAGAPVYRLGRMLARGDRGQPLDFGQSLPEASLQVHHCRLRASGTASIALPVGALLCHVVSGICPLTTVTLPNRPDQVTSLVS
jgi:hypothetical protein